MGCFERFKGGNGQEGVFVWWTYLWVYGSVTLLVDGWLSNHPFPANTGLRENFSVDPFQTLEENYWRVESKEVEITWKGPSHGCPFEVKKRGGRITTTTHENTHLSSSNEMFARFHRFRYLRSVLYGSKSGESKSRLFWKSRLFPLGRSSRSFQWKKSTFRQKSNYRVIGVILVGKRRFYAVNDKQKCEFIVPSQMVIEASRWRKVAALLQLYSYTEQQY